MENVETVNIAKTFLKLYYILLLLYVGFNAIKIEECGVYHYNNSFLFFCNNNHNPSVCLVKCQAMKIGPLYPLIFFYYENEKDNYEIDSFNSFKSNSGGQKCLIHTNVVQHSAGLNQYFVLVPLNRGALL